MSIFIIERHIYRINCVEMYLYHHYVFKITAESSVMRHITVVDLRTNTVITVLPLRTVVICRYLNAYFLRDLAVKTL